MNKIALRDAYQTIRTYPPKQLWGQILVMPENQLVYGKELLTTACGLLHQNKTLAIEVASIQDPSEALQAWHKHKDHQGLTIISQSVFDALGEKPTQTVSYKTEQSLRLAEVQEMLASFGYEHTPGTVFYNFFTKKGGLIKIGSPAHTEVVTLDFLGNSIERILIGKRVVDTVTIPEAGLAIGIDYQNALADVIELAEAPMPEHTSFKRDYKTFAKTLTKLSKNKVSMVVLTAVPKQTRQMLANITSTNVAVSPCSLSVRGFTDLNNKLAVFTDIDIYGEAQQATGSKRINYALLDQLKPGNFVVHADHGIGMYTGTTTHDIDGGRREYLGIEYAKGDKLFVPVEYVEKLSKYLGASRPVLHRLHGNAWHQVQKRLKVETKRIAQELLALHARREIAQGFAYAGNEDNEQAFADTFPYTMTPDQTNAWHDIETDMRAEQPMDRIIAGDVGFGKTELAMRAAFKAVQSGKQAAVLAPTTILAEQHYETFSRRMAEFKVRVAILSRFHDATEQKKTLIRLAEGKVDIVIGTHRLLSVDVAFKDLGLLVIDEEQRFGVAHKEKLKKLRTHIDILTLTATPIPRTLHFALAGMRAISKLETPPPSRLAIDTYVKPFDPTLVKQVVEAELKRNGQVFFVHNRVETIESAKREVQRLVPKARMAVVHGQLPEEEITRVMHEFRNKQADVLVASSIIENGIDFASANTLIVDDATNFGLAQLYQMRGRVGRGSVQAHAYFLYREQKLVGDAKARLRALKEAKELGSGFTLALRDMEIRGSGNFLGSEQSGNIQAAGLGLYARLLQQAIDELKHGGGAQSVLDVTIDLPLTALVPKEFMESDQDRLRFYQEITELRTLKELQDHQKQTTRALGELPAEVQNLYFVLRLKHIASDIRVLAIDTRICHGQEGTRRLLRLTLAEDLTDQQMYALIKKNSDWEQIEKTIVQITFAGLGDNWTKTLEILLQNWPRKPDPNQSPH